MTNQFKIEAIDESGNFEDMLAERFETLEEAVAATKDWDFPGVVMHIVDTENVTIAWKNYEGDPLN